MQCHWSFGLSTNTDESKKNLWWRCWKIDLKERLDSRVRFRCLRETMWRSASSPVCWKGAGENIENVTLVKKCQYTPTSQYFYLLNISSYSPSPSPNNPCGSGVSVSCTCGDGSTFTPGSVHRSTTTSLSSSLANIFKTIFYIDIGWVEK